MTREDDMRTAEDRWTQWVPRDEYLVIRVDGRAFHTFTKGMARPYSPTFMMFMNTAARKLCEEIQGAVFAFVQSDEISVLVRPDTGVPRTSGQWFGGSVRKILSITASIASASVSLDATNDLKEPRVAQFDSRILTFAERQDVIRYFLWRQSDCARNAIQACAQEWCGHKKVYGKDRVAQLRMIEAAGHRYDDVPQGFRQGRVILSYEEAGIVSYTHKGTNEVHTAQVVRNVWRPAPAPWFDWDSAGFLESTIPTRES